MKTNHIIDTFLHPKSVAVIGASKNPLKGGNRIATNLITNNYNGQVHFINPNAEGELYKIPFKRSILDVEEEVDLAIFYVPNKIIPAILKDCIKKGIKGAIIEASGFGEVGRNGIELRDQIVEITDRFSKIRIVGPNCMGLSTIDGDSDSSEKSGFFSGFGVYPQFKRGNIAILSQSGMLNGGYLMHIISKYPDIGIRYSCSIGNKMDISEIEFLEYFLKDDTVNVIAIYLESFRDPRKFIELCKQAKELPNKTIILVKGGQTELGKRATLSHTGSLAENSNLINAVIKQAGVIKANSFYELFEYARTLSMIYNSGKIMPKKGNVAFIAGSGGAGTITADLTSKYGLNFPEFNNNTYQELLNIFPDWMPPNKFAFVDIWPAMEKAMMNRIHPDETLDHVYQLLLNEPEIEGIFTMRFCSRKFRTMGNIKKNIDSLNKSDKPSFFWLVGDAQEVADISKELASNNIPNFNSLEDMVKNFEILVQESNNKKK